MANEEKLLKENIVIEPLDDVMGDRYGIYAKYVIQDRAIPDARDGLKPVQRRIVYSMWTNHNTSQFKTRKCAKIVGDVIGKYHPHGDTSVYEALARMSQDWKVRMPLITFQGNNGSIDGDQPAAYRYTEAKLSELADELVRDLNKNAVEKALTYDDTEYEPVVLPARFPNLYINGAEGIAVALATEIPPHNLEEVINAIIYRITHARAEPRDLMKFVRGPDFPTGGVIVSSEGLKNIYLTGHGRIEITARAKINTNDKVNKIVITEIPYKAVKINIVHEIDEIRHKKIIEGILEVRDESDRRGLKIVVDCRKNVNPEAILRFLMSKTGLTTGYTANIVAIVNGHPRTLNILDYVDCYIAHQVDVITRVSNFDLAKNKARLEIVNGLIKAIKNLDEVIRIIRASKDKADAKHKLEETYKFSEAQSEAIVMMPLYKLSHTDVNTLNEEKKNLENEIARLKAILGDRKVLNKELVRDLKEIAKKYGNERRTIIKHIDKEDKEFDQRDLINKEDVMVAMTRDGYVKRSSLKSYKSSEGSLPGVKAGDCLVLSHQANTEDFLIAFTNKGNYLILPVHQIAETKWKDEGKALSIKISSYNAQEEKIIKAFTVKAFRKDLFFVLVSKNGQIKRTLMSEFVTTKFNRTYTAMRLLANDELIDVSTSTGSDNILLFLANGEASFYNEDVLTPIGPKAGGVKAVKLTRNSVAAMLTFKKDEKTKVMIITDHGCSRMIDNLHVPLTKRLIKPVVIMPTFKGDPHKIIAARKLINVKDELSIYAISQLKGLLNLKITDFYMTPLDKYAKTNLPVIKKDHLLRLYSDGEHVNPNLKSTYKPKPNTNEGNKDNTKNEKYTQISIFDEDN